MNATAFTELEFWILVIFSGILPLAIYIGLLRTRSVSRFTVLAFGCALVAISGIDIYLLKSLERIARFTPSLADDLVFVSEVSLALYILPAVFAGIGINIISHVLVRHLSEAERRFDRTHSDA